MGNYIHIGIATKIIVSKHRRYSNDVYLADEILNKLENKFNLFLYDIAENDEVVGLVLKDRILEEHLYSYLYEQADDLAYSENIKRELQKIKNKDAHEILQMFRDCQMEYIYYNDHDYMQHTYLDEDLELYIEGITYLSDGKIMMETYYEFLNYIHSLLRKSSKLALKDATYITIN